VEDDDSFVLVRGFLYPMRVWLNALTVATTQYLDEKLPKAGLLSLLRALPTMKHQKHLNVIQLLACDTVEKNAVGVLPQDMTEPFQIVAVFPVDNTVPPR